MGNAIPAENIGQKMIEMIRPIMAAANTPAIILTGIGTSFRISALVFGFGIGGTSESKVSTEVCCSVSSCAYCCATALASTCRASGAMIAIKLHIDNRKPKMTIKMQNHCHLRWVLLTRNLTVELTHADTSRVRKC